MGAQLDTGANITQLTSSTIGKILGTTRIDTTDRKTGLVGLGAAVDAETSELPALDYQLAGSWVRASGVTIKAGSDGKNVVGSDIIYLLRRLEIDFDAMAIVANSAR